MKCNKPNHTGELGNCKECLRALQANMPAALGIPNPDGPRRAPAEVAERVLGLAVKYLLYERSEQTALTIAFAGAVEERHNHFHVKAFTKPADLVPWTDCMKPQCREAREIIGKTVAREIHIHPLSAQLMDRFLVNFMPTPASLRFWLVSRDESLPATEDEQRAASKLVLPS